MTERMGETLALALALEGRVDAAQGDTRQLVALAQTLAQLPDPEINASFADALEQQLLTDGLPVGRPVLTLVTTDTVEETTPRAPVVQMPSRRLTVRRSVAGVAAAASLTAFPLVAAAQSLPGSPFYGLKQKIHAAQIALFGGPVEDGFHYMGWANQQVSEAGQLADMPAPNQNLIAETLEGAADKLGIAQELVLGNTSDPAALNRLASMALDTANDIRDFNDGSGPLSPAARSAMLNVLNASASIQQAVSNVLDLPVTPVLDAGVVMHTPAPAAGPTGQTSGSSNRSNTTKSDGGKSDGSSRIPGDDGRTSKTVDDGKREACQRIGEAQLNDSLLKPIYDPTCSKPGSNI